jgi:hypothetical protein
MPAPVINKTQSSLTFGLNQAFSFQFVATNSPTTWAIGTNEVLPPGFVFNPTSGVLTGSGQTPGIWLLTLTATNADGNSTPEVFTIGVFETAAGQVFKQMNIDTSTWLVTLPDPAVVRAVVTGSELPALEATAGQARYGDDVLFKIQLISGTAATALPLVGARFSMRGLDTEPPFFTTAETAFRRTTTIESGLFVTNYWLYASLEDPALSNFLAENEYDSSTEANVICEVELVFERPSTATGPMLQKITTVPFLMRIRRDTVR